MIAFNTPELAGCDGFAFFGICVPWLLLGLLLGTAALVLSRAMRALAQRARVLGGHESSPQPGGFIGVPPRVSLIRLVPVPSSKQASQ